MFLRGKPKSLRCFRQTGGSVFSFLTFFIQTQAETDEQEVVERPQEDPVIARRVESVHRREAQKEGDGRMEEKGTQHS